MQSGNAKMILKISRRICGSERGLCRINLEKGRRSRRSRRSSGAGSQPWRQRRPREWPSSLRAAKYNSLSRDGALFYRIHGRVRIHRSPRAIKKPVSAKIERWRRWRTSCIEYRRGRTVWRKDRWRFMHWRTTSIRSYISIWRTW